MVKHLKSHFNYMTNKQMNTIEYKVDIVPTPDVIIDLYEDAGLPRPTKDRERIKKMYDNSNLIITAWDNEILVGVSRCLTDFCWSCYLADLAVRSEYKKAGIGKELIRLTKEKVGPQSMVLLLSVPDALKYYPKVGFEKHERAFILHRDHEVF